MPKPIHLLSWGTPWWISREHREAVWIGSLCFTTGQAIVPPRFSKKTTGLNANFTTAVRSPIGLAVVSCKLLTGPHVGAGQRHLHAHAHVHAHVHVENKRGPRLGAAGPPSKRVVWRWPWRGELVGKELGPKPKPPGGRQAAVFHIHPSSTTTYIPHRARPGGSHGHAPRRPAERWARRCG